MGQDHSYSSAKQEHTWASWKQMTINNKGGEDDEKQGMGRGEGGGGTIGSYIMRFAFS